MPNLKSQESPDNSRLYYEKLLQSMPSGFALHEIICDNNGQPCDYRFIEANSAFEEITGLKTSEILGKTVLEVIPDMKKSWIDKCGEVALTGKKIEFEQYAASLERCYEVTAYCPKPGQFATIFNDITARKKAEEEQQETEERFTAFMDHLPAATFIKDIEGVTLYANQYLMNEFGGETWIGKTTDKLFPREAAKEMIAADQKALEEGLQVIIEELYDKNNAAKTYRTLKFPIKRGNKAQLLGGISMDITEQKRAEKALMESEQKYRALADQSVIGIAISQFGKVIYANDAISRIYGYSKDEMLSWGPEEYAQSIYPEDREFVLEQARKRLMGDPEALPQYDVRIITTSGEIKWVTIHSSVIQLASGHAVISSLIDMTERKRSEEALLRSEHEKALILESTSDVIVYQDRDFKILWANKAASNYIGLRPEEMAGKYCFALWRHRKEPCADCPVVDALRTGEIHQRENKTLDGRIWIDRGYPVRDEEGIVIGAVEVSTDITARKLMEDELRQSEEKYRNIIESVPIGMLMCQLISGEKLIFYDANPAAAEILGVDTEQFIGKTIEEVFPTLAETEVPERYRLAASKGVAWVSDEITYQDNQVSGAYEVHAFQTAPDKMVAAFMDITDRKRAETEREDLIADLEAKNAELERFVYTVSHDLKSPLITIMGFLGFLGEDLKNGNIERAEEDIQRISNAGKRMQQLLDELLELSRIGRLNNPPQWVFMSDMAKKALEMVKGQQKGGLIDVKIAPNLPRVYGDAPRLLEVYANLIDNAIKFIGESNPNPCIEIGFYHKADECVYYVKDNGIGIEPRYHKKVFELFQRLDQRYEGTGVGLAIVKRIIEAQGGRIWIESEGVNQGTTFYFTLLAKDQGTINEE